MKKDESLPEEDFLFNLCMQFQNVVPFEGMENSRNALFTAIHVTVRSRIKKELKTAKFTSYPLISEICPELIPEWQLHPTIWSKQQQDYVSAVLSVLDTKKKVTMSDGRGA
jgi:hypothetical protein